MQHCEQKWCFICIYSSGAKFGKSLIFSSGAREAEGRPSEANSSLLFSSITQKFKIQVQIYISIIYTLDIYLVKYSNHDMKNWFVVQLPRTCKFGGRGMIYSTRQGILDSFSHGFFNCLSGFNK